MLLDVIPLNDLTTETETHSEASERRIERAETVVRRVVAPGRESVEGREIYMRARAIFKRAGRTRASRSAAIL